MLFVLKFYLPTSPMVGLDLFNLNIVNIKLKFNQVLGSIAA